MNETCPMLGDVILTRQAGVEIHRCNHFGKSCTVEDHKIHVPSGMMQTCEGCPAKAMLLARSEPPAPPAPMTLFERAMELARVMANTAKTGLADESLIKARLAICAACPQFVDNQCKVCGCKVVREKNLVNKLAHISSVCADRDNPRW